MALAKKCDRCGQFYEEKESNALEELARSLIVFNENAKKGLIR